MKIVKINVYQVDITLKETQACNDRQKCVAVFDSTVVEIVTDTGLIGIGEICPWPDLLPIYSNGVRAGIRKIGPALIGLNPLEVDKINDVMNRELQGHPCCKTPIDIACWDILGKHCNLPVTTLLGGRYGSGVPLYQTIASDTAHNMVDSVRRWKQQGYSVFQLKVGGRPKEDIERIRECRKVTDDNDIVMCDANTGWLTQDAMKIIKSVKDLDLYIEQPCSTYDECIKVRHQTSMPFILDESITCFTDVLKVHHDRLDTTVGLKISKMGGITQMRKCRDLCVKLGFTMKIDEAWGSEITQAVLAHLAQSTPERYRVFVPVLSPLNGVQVASGLPDIIDGTITASHQPGLGITLNHDVIGNPLFTIQ